MVGIPHLGICTYMHENINVNYEYSKYCAIIVPNTVDNGTKFLYDYMCVCTYYMRKKNGSKEEKNIVRSLKLRCISTKIRFPQFLGSVPARRK